MGELDVMTKNIDALQGRVEQQLQSQISVNEEIAETRRQFISILENLKTEVDAFKNGQIKSIQNQLGIALQHIEAQTRSQLEIIDKNAHHYSIIASKKEAEIIRESAVDAREKAVKGTLAIIDKRFADALGSVTGANKSFENAKSDFIRDVNACVEDAKTAVNGYDKALKASVKNHKPIGLFGVFTLALLASAMSAGSVLYYSAQKTVSGTSDQTVSAAARGAKFDEVFQQLDKQTKEKILKLWK